ncbi:HAD family hydrolase [Streptomyces armeniacus]|uniref:HAD family hydrolase n=1 Tax=Streptomyces armeniacus TaxID=83291 RepID=A0A345XN94_9ACTN|nr:HAD family hydrolase [Streptomyces armeniacus]AXK33110.1 HAD family hydrolase [Streptomyces armeniacus]
MRYDLVIFDNDGVLVDSEPIANRILSAYLSELGHPTTYEDALRDYMGGSVQRVHDLVRERSGQQLPADFDEVLHQRTFETFRRELQPVTGVSEVLEKLAADGVPRCVASSGTHERIRVALHKTGLYAHFGEERIFSSQDVAHGKPAPDLFLHAAAAMGVRPERCAVVEDSPLGVRAALAAGMDVYGYTAMTPPAKLRQAQAEARGESRVDSRAGVLFDDMSALPGLLAG